MTLEAVDLRLQQDVAARAVTEGLVKPTPRNLLNGSILSVTSVVPNFQEPEDGSADTYYITSVFLPLSGVTIGETEYDQLRTRLRKNQVIVPFPIPLGTPYGNACELRVFPSSKLSDERIVRTHREITRKFCYEYPEPIIKHQIGSNNTEHLDVLSLAIVGLARKLDSVNPELIGSLETAQKRWLSQHRNGGFRRSNADIDAWYLDAALQRIPTLKRKESYIMRLGSRPQTRIQFYMDKKSEPQISVGVFN